MISFRRFTSQVIHGSSRQRHVHHSTNASHLATQAALQTTMALDGLLPEIVQNGYSHSRERSSERLAVFVVKQLNARFTVGGEDGETLQDLVNCTYIEFRIEHCARVCCRYVHAILSAPRRALYKCKSNFVTNLDRWPMRLPNLYYRTVLSFEMW